MIDALVLDGTVTLLALAILVLEIIAILWVARAPAVRRLALANALSGIFLILALRSALLDHGATTVVLWLSFGLLAHIADLGLRLRR